MTVCGFQKVIRLLAAESCTALCIRFATSTAGLWFNTGLGCYITALSHVYRLHHEAGKEVILESKLAARVTMSLFVLCLVPGYTIHSITRAQSVRLTVQTINDHFNKGEPTEEQCPIQFQT
jgi:hypothetical protein